MGTSGIWFADIEAFYGIWKYSIIQEALRVLSIFLWWKISDPKCLDTSIPKFNKTLDQHKLISLVTNPAAPRE